jgi:hypothetical protein
MQEGWLGDDYLILFAESEVKTASIRYSISEFLPGYVVVGLRSWDDLIVKDSAGKSFSVPAVPMSSDYLAAFFFPPIRNMQADDRFRGKVKWYLKPPVFGGNPKSEDNITWVDHQSHGELVNWWNRLYRESTRS